MPAAARFALTSWRPDEHELQINCVKMLDRLLLPGVVFTSHDNAFSLNMRLGRNGRPIGFAEIAKRKARGIRPGIPDLEFVVPPDGQSWWIELKRDRDHALEPEQVVYINRLLAAGCRVQICWTIDQVLETTYAWGLLRPGSY